MTDPPGMVVRVSAHVGDVVFSPWNYTDAEIEVNVGAEAVEAADRATDQFLSGHQHSWSRLERGPARLGATVHLGMPTRYPYWLPVGVYNVKVQPNTDGIWSKWRPASKFRRPNPLLTVGIPSFPVGHRPVRKL